MISELTLNRNCQPFVRLAISKLKHKCDMNESSKRIIEGLRQVKAGNTFKDKSGLKFSRLTVLKRIGVNKHGHVVYLCRCDCGNATPVEGDMLAKGNTKSCGCLQIEAASKINRTHGFTRGGKLPREYITWESLKSRCYSPTNINYKSYGGRGIGVCKRWRHSFPNFLKDMGKKPTPEHSIERKNNDKDYKPSNCRWATLKEQANNRRDTRRFTFQGKTKTVTDWSEITKFKAKTILARIKRGWAIEKALTHKLIGRK